MKTRLFAFLFLLALSLHINAQSQFKIAGGLYSGLSDSLTNEIVNSLDKLLLSINNEQLDTSLIDSEDADLNYNFFRYLKGIEGKDSIPKFYQAQLINLYPLEKDKYMLTIAYTKNDEIGRMLSVLVKENNGKIVFANPLKYNTRFWKTATIGTVTYFFPDMIDTERAAIFNQKNISIARKLNLPVRNWDVYICNDFQEVIRLQGYAYDHLHNGKHNSGYIMDPNTLFSCMNDEDFSHDVLHIYASQIRGKERNVVGECGLAYYWGNAYHSGITGKAPELDELVPLLQQHLKSHKDVKLLGLFEKSPNVLAEYGYPWPIHVNRVIAGVICREIERQKGTEGIIKLLKCGRGNDNLFKVTEELIGISRDNFDEEVYKLVLAY